MKIIEKIYSPKVGTKISWHQTMPYKLGDEGKSFPFNVQIISKSNEVLENVVVNVPSMVLEMWDSDEIITNYLLSQLNLELDLDNTIDLVLEKLNNGTITYASGIQEENDVVLKNYANFISLNIKSYKEGSLSLDEFPTLQGFNVSIELDGETFDIVSFVKSLVETPAEEKSTKLNNCITSITEIINIEP